MLLGSLSFIAVKIALLLSGISFALSLQFFMIDFLINFGFSNLGLSSVTYILSQYLLAIFPIMDLFFLSLSPPHPKTMEIFLLDSFRKDLRVVSKASGV